MAALYLTEQDVAAVVDMPLALEAVASAHLALAKGEAVDCPRQRVRSGKSIQHLLQGGLFDARKVTGYKVYTSSRAGVRFWLHLFDAERGDPLAVIEANRLGMMRTGAAGGVAARALAREDSRRAVVFGAGWQARGQLEALALSTSVEQIAVVARDATRLDAFCCEMAALTGREVFPAEDIEAAVRQADVVVTITTAAAPLFKGEWLAEGCHVTAAGSNALIRREIDETCVSRAGLVVVDSRATALREAGDLLPALEKGRLREGALVELGEILAGHRAGRSDQRMITLFESQGLAVQDLALGVEVLTRAQSAKLGTLLPY
ncbi:ornithine cyclodeaminase family protein [Niveibacterium sp. 24ML]|uniref:ornithine cyclodeaminase family protein n=1 Tax=Niveibacterium sp. 24ML TaxID=2985512 RepID=UPI00226DD005|nr:ornithine cyclodeaminase family protein [Niveibacterium sp. 24ML]MCX9154881.1 ornithine cyclodeaminase family protein [Niveibacterium sp. 24ML]